MKRFSATLTLLQHWDARVCVSFNRAIHVRILLRLFRAVSRLGNGIFWYALMLALLLSDPVGALGPVLHMAIAGAGGTIVYKLLKHRTLRPRPYQVHSHVAAGAQPLDQFSFPSGHTLHAVVFTLIACTYWPGLALVTVPFTLLTAASRMVLGLHYPSDVLAGGALGALIALLSFSIPCLVV